MAVDSDPAQAGYGDIRILALPQNVLAAGPQQVQNTFESDPAAAAQLAMLRRAGSRVILGNLITLPVGAGFLYVEPMYVEAPSGAGAYPTLQKVLVSYGGTVGYASTVQGALDEVFTGLATPLAAAGAGGEAGAAVRSDIARAEQDFAAAQTALKASDFPAYGRDIAGMKEALDDAQQAAAAK